MTFVSVKPRRRKAVAFNTDFDKMVNAFIQSDLPTYKNGQSRNFSPAINVLETADDFQIELAAPGLEKTDFSVNVEKNVLTIEVNKTAEKEEGVTYKRKEFSASNFKRQFELPETVNAAEINATYINGILLLTIPKKEEAKELPPKQIEIS